MFSEKNPKLGSFLGKSMNFLYVMKFQISNKMIAILCLSTKSQWLKKQEGKSQY